MFTKWIIAVFFSVSTLMASNAKAEAAEGGAFIDVRDFATHKSLLRIREELNRERDPEARLAHLKSGVEKTLGMKVDVSKYVLKSYRAAVERALNSLQSSSTLRALENLKAKCRLDPKKINLGSNDLAGDTYLTANVKVFEIADTFNAKAARCEKVFEAHSRVSEKLAPRKFDLPGDFVYNSRDRANHLIAWAAALERGYFTTALFAFELHCRVPVSKVHYRTFLNYEDREGSLAFDYTTRPSEVRKKISRAASACESTVEKLALFNRINGIEYNLLVTLDMNNFLNGKISSEQVIGWLSHFARNPEKLGQVRDLALQSASDDQFSDFRACLDRQSGSPYHRCDILMELRLGTYDRVPSPSGLLAAMFIVFDIASAPAYLVASMGGGSSFGDEVANKYRLLTDRPVHIKITGGPVVPKRF